VAISEAEVQVKVKVDKAGRVVNAKAVASTSLVTNSLVLVTQDAARLWRFAPAMRGNDPVASEVLLIFRFRPKITVN
jgi:outer membrane biosynthesis protein TonB